MSDYFLLDPDYENFPDKQKLKFLTVYGEQHTYIALAILMLIFSILMFLLMLSALWQELPYFTGSEQTQATVKASCQPTHKSFTYTFEVADTQGKMQQYAGEVPQDRNTPCPKAGDQITVEYIFDKPSSTARYMPEGTSSLSTMCVFGFALLVMIVFIQSAYIDVAAFFQARTKYPLLKAATAILTGRIIAVKNSKKDNVHGRLRGDYCIEIQYEFIVNKQLLTGKQLHRRNDLIGKQLPPPGTHVRILYADENTYVML